MYIPARAKDRVVLLAPSSSQDAALKSLLSFTTQGYNFGVAVWNAALAHGVDKRKDIRSFLSWVRGQAMQDEVLGPETEPHILTAFEYGASSAMFLAREKPDHPTTTRSANGRMRMRLAAERSPDFRLTPSKVHLPHIGEVPLREPIADFKEYEAYPCAAYLRRVLVAARASDVAWELKMPMSREPFNAPTEAPGPDVSIAVNPNLFQKGK